MSFLTEYCYWCLRRRRHWRRGDTLLSQVLRRQNSTFPGQSTCIRRLVVSFWQGFSHQESILTLNREIRWLVSTKIDITSLCNHAGSGDYYPPYEKSIVRRINTPRCLRVHWDLGLFLLQTTLSNREWSYHHRRKATERWTLSRHIHSDEIVLLRSPSSITRLDGE